MTKISVKVPDILLPNKSVDMSKWAVVACDQYTSEPEYWEGVKKATEGSPSALNVIFPEVYLSKDNAPIIESINKTMYEYLDTGVLQSIGEGFVLIERSTPITPKRLGLVMAVDLEDYSFVREDKANIRATEGTILSRIPPRKEIRLHAPLEVPHIMVLISDSERSVIEPLKAKRDKLEKAYDTPLMMNGGHITGYVVSSGEDKAAVISALSRIRESLDPSNPLLFAMGDGNHSLATAKSLWEDIKKGLSEEERESHPARYALVEIENIFDEGLAFEPIHRIFYSITLPAFMKELEKAAPGSTAEKISKDEIHERVNESKGSFVLYDGSEYILVRLHGTEKELAAWTVQLIIDSLLEQKACTVDYIHGMEETLSLAGSGNIALILPDIPKDTFFSSILSDRAFPRKTFSIGHADEKRYYMEARRIR